MMDRTAPDKDPETNKQPADAGSSRTRPFRMILNIAIGLSLLVSVYFAFAIVSRNAVPEPVVEEQPRVRPPRVIQIDVLNGCGAKGVASSFTNHLRRAGFDVVEMKNYKVSTIPRTLIVDRVGDLSAARDVASALGVSESNVVQQINPDYFVDVSVIIGGDYATLQPLSR